MAEVAFRMSLQKIYTAICFGKQVLNSNHGAVKGLWRIFGREIRRLRREQRIGLKSFAKKLGVSCGMVSFMEAGEREWSDARARKAMKLLSK